MKNNMFSKIFKRTCKHEMSYRSVGAWSYGRCDKCNHKTRSGYGLPTEEITNRDYYLVVRDDKKGIRNDKIDSLLI